MPTSLSCLPQVEQDLVTALADSISTGDNVIHQEKVVSHVMQPLLETASAMHCVHLAGMPPRNCDIFLSTPVSTSCRRAGSVHDECCCMRRRGRESAAKHCSRTRAAQGILSAPAGRHVHWPGPTRAHRGARQLQVPVCSRQGP